MDKNAAINSIELFDAIDKLLENYDIVHDVYTGIPKPKPRMTQADRWKKRPCVLRYRDFADDLRSQVQAPEGEVRGLSFIAYLPIPKSYYTPKGVLRKPYIGLPGSIHLKRPDKDNLEKAIMDVLFKEDCKIATGFGEKRWDDGKGPRIEIWFHLNP